MAIRSTKEINGRTIRTWEESRGDRILIREFYLSYQITFESKDKVLYRYRETKADVTELLNDVKAVAGKIESTYVPYTHLPEFKPFECVINGTIYKVYVNEYASGESNTTIREYYENY